MDKTISDAIKTEQELAAVLEDLKEKITNAIRDSKPMSGVQPIRGNPNSAAVSFSTISASPNLCLSPGYYLQGTQADAVVSAVASCRSVSDLVGRVRNMVERRSTTHGSLASTPLNEQTLQVLKEFLA